VVPVWCFKALVSLVEDVQMLIGCVRKSTPVISANTSVCLCGSGNTKQAESFLQKLIVAYLLQMLPIFYKTRRTVTVYPILSQMNAVHTQANFIETHLNIISGRCSSAGIAIRLRAGRSGVIIPAGRRDYIFENVQTGSGAQPAFYLMGT
jgi:hypothetical protein